MNVFLQHILFFSFLFLNTSLSSTKVFISFIDSTKTTVVIDSSITYDSLKVDSTTSKRRKNVFSTPTDSVKFYKSIQSYLRQKKQIDFSDYKYTGNLVSLLPFSFLNDLGHTGLPSEPNLYGYGFGNSSISINGISINNRWKNSFNLNNIQTEGIEKISLTPLPRGFLFNVTNNPANLNIILNDTLKNQPISRIRYYQASNNEAFIDAMFSARVIPRLAILFRATNISTNDRYENTEFNSWKANFKTTYKFSNNYYASLNYDHLKSQTRLNGGIDISSIAKQTNDYKSILYNTTFAPVNFSDRYVKTTQHNIQINLLGRVLGKNLSKIIFAYENNLEEFRQSENDLVEDSTRIFNDNKYTLYSSQLEQEINEGNIHSKFVARFENIKLDLPNIPNIEDQTNYYAWLLLNYKLLNGIITPSIYAKSLNYDGQVKNGFGLDITSQPLNYLNLYIGFSTFGKPYSFLEKYSLPISQFNKEQTISTFLTSVSFNYLFTKTSISYFETINNNVPVPVFSNSIEQLSNSHITYTFTDNFSNKGINFSSKNMFWNIQANANFNYYFNSNSQLANVPEYSLLAGIYYVDTLFNSNLNLKTGFTFYLNSEVDFRVYDFQRGQSTKLYLKDNVAQPFTTLPLNNNSNRLDFFLAGRIQDKATFYFTLENILDDKYYVIPFYPMHPRGIRIGLSWDFIN